MVMTILARVSPSVPSKSKMMSRNMSGAKIVEIRENGGGRRARFRAFLCPPTCWSIRPGTTWVDIVPCDVLNPLAPCRHHPLRGLHLGQAQALDTRRDRTASRAFQSYGSRAADSIRPPDPHLQKPVLQRIGFGASFLFVGQDLIIQQGGDGVLDGTG